MLGARTRGGGRPRTGGASNPAAAGRGGSSRTATAVSTGARCVGMLTSAARTAMCTPAETPTRSHRLSERRPGAGFWIPSNTASSASRLPRRPRPPHEAALLHPRTRTLIDSIVTPDEVLHGGHKSVDRVQRARSGKGAKQANRAPTRNGSASILAILPSPGKPDTRSLSRPFRSRPPSFRSCRTPPLCPQVYSPRMPACRFAVAPKLPPGQPC